MIKDKGRFFPVPEMGKYELMRSGESTYGSERAKRERLSLKRGECEMVMANFILGEGGSKYGR